MISVETQALPSSTTSWADMLADAGVSSHLAHDPAVTRLISAAYSYPMTLRHYLPGMLICLCIHYDSIPTLTLQSSLALLPSISSSIDAAHRVYILGARAEATMPRHLWTPLHPWRLDISLIGNHVPVMRSTPPSPPSSSLNLSFHNGLYHDLDLPSPHAFVLFNPGLGHPALRSQWRPTLARVLESHRPILLTSFSDEDLQRDVRVLETAGRRIDIAENPFGSTKASIDPMHVVAAPVHSNRFVCVVH
ncbi:hypothetical protein DYB26_015749 [Aphanomyces astaci]|uniref:Mitochondrial splicing suppressor 51-like C-terminal domain-containing protein n=1 Tax=Aphanomyces astaci TaxID=112090 RepID=A0A397EZ23_APHAT|nr:hypothetical protein DYB26_015749 [Aphanomyces astaci]RHZ05691.1 hypothetical protein DYB31_007888 [Aphanomyces astaci]